MDFLEKDLEQVIYEATEEQLSDFEFPTGIKKRQLRIGSYGVADLVYFKRVSVGFLDNKKTPNKTEFYCCKKGLRITVCELKKDKIGISAFLQAINYCKGISEYLNKRGFNNYYFDILLIGKEIDKSGSFVYITDLIGDSGREGGQDIDFSEGINPSNYFNHRINNVSFKKYSYGFNGINFTDESNYSITNNGF